MRRETKDCKVTRETSVGKRWPGPGRRSTNEKQTTK